MQFLILFKPYETNCVLPFSERIKERRDWNGGFSCESCERRNQGRKLSYKGFSLVRGSDARAGAFRAILKERDPSFKVQLLEYDMRSSLLGKISKRFLTSSTGIFSYHLIANQRLQIAGRQISNFSRCR